jgi:UDP-N-acetylglucosamine diphosphorylase / glucose-1-phosphate thymidylyltransferase / UDP-N-acetylgalactosamine diphosphorylase / glucosamine-1-phosphate N-acetyltransferase / galactosamine-1-phosphate N-acetyltransferase
MDKLVGLIPAAGKGVRARPYTSLVPKGMLQIDGRPNLERIICQMRDDLGIDEIYMTVGYLSDVIKEYFQDGSRLGVQLHYIDNTELDKGLAWSILLAGKHLTAPCCVMLSDECYIGSNHSELLNFPYEKGLATCSVMSADDTKMIQRNYSIVREGNRACRLLEKPQVLENNLLGLGTFILTPDFFPLLTEAFAQSKQNYVEFVTFIDSLCDRDPGVLCFEMKGTYVNINDRDSLNLARYYERKRTFANNKISLLLYSEGVEQNIGFTISRYRQNPAIHDIYVVLPDNNTIADKIIACGAQAILCPPDITLYGEKISYALDRLPGDIFVLAEAEYTFPEHDINKLLEYLQEADMVAGTRTTRQLIEQGSDMRGLVRIANIALAKLIELLWWRHEVRISDVGCTFRAMWRSCYEDIRNQWQAKGPEFLAEMMVELLHDRKRLIEIPVSYYNRSEAMHKKYRNRKTFLRILYMLGRKRCQPLARVR